MDLLKKIREKFLPNKTFSNFSLISSKKVINKTIAQDILKKYYKNHKNKDIIHQNKKQVFSQWNEDGILKNIFKKLGTTNKFYVEFGAWDGVHLSNTANFRINHNWKGLLLEGNRSKVKSVKEKEKLNLHWEWITDKNINKVFNKYNVPTIFDLLSIDIDGNDYWVWKALTSRPRVVIIETNPGIRNDIALSIQKDKSDIHTNSNSNYHGANLNALYQLAIKKGYEFVTTEEINAIFVVKEEFHKLGINHISKEECIENYFKPQNYWLDRYKYKKKMGYC